MKKFKTISLFSLFTTSLIIGTLQAEGPNYGMCGAKPGMIDRLFTNAEKIRIKCIEDAYEANKEKVRKEIEELHATSSKLSLELKEVAIKVDFNIVQCAPQNAGPARDPKLIKRCQELVTAKNAIISRIDELSGWKDMPRTKNTRDAKETNSPNNSNILPSPPCPSKEKLKEMQPVRMFNKKLYQTWERCVMGNVEDYVD